MRSLELPWILFAGCNGASNDYQTTGSPRLKGHHERRSVVVSKNLTIPDLIVLPVRFPAKACPGLDPGWIRFASRNAPK
jgi:hypothetical protein